MEIYDDPNRVYPQRPPAQAYNRRYRKNAPSMELFLVGGVLFLSLGGIALLLSVADLFAQPNTATLFLLVGSVPLFLAGGLGIRFRHYPHMAKVCFAASLLADACCILWLFVETHFLPGVIGLVASAIYALAWIVNHR